VSTPSSRAAPTPCRGGPRGAGYSNYLDQRVAAFRRKPRQHVRARCLNVARPCRNQVAGHPRTTRSPLVRRSPATRGPRAATGSSLQPQVIPGCRPALTGRRSLAGVSICSRQSSRPGSDRPAAWFNPRKCATLASPSHDASLSAAGERERTTRAHPSKQLAVVAPGPMAGTDRQKAHLERSALAEAAAQVGRIRPRVVTTGIAVTLPTPVMSCSIIVTGQTGCQGCNHRYPTELVRLSSHIASNDLRFESSRGSYLIWCYGG